ncbi:MAG TPA: ATP-binding protein [Candidatus Nesterenkonia stercoripullorum]|uniref:ATP-binding protein n=1 Tax=Candidatus Nesterenkonia stercoripullorum TaxID=2838701 RepID=A0A9D2A8L0_9MICC|nr:ATP-binding protein [Candidatus Nesterenkonia stercoripullorum]
MSMGRARGVALIGLEGHIIEVEADIGQSLPAFVLLGLPDASLRESQDRIRSAAKNSGIPLPARRLTVNLLPASLPKSGSALDLAILMSSWEADGQVGGIGEAVFIAELGLDGSLRPVRGVLVGVAAARRAGICQVVVSTANAAEAALVPGVEVLAMTHVREAAQRFRARGKPEVSMLQAGRQPHGDQEGRAPGHEADLASRAGAGPVVDSLGDDASLGVTPALERAVGDLAEVHGQEEARFALEVAAAGRHHLLLIGAPGAGKTMLASRLPGILPQLDDGEAMEVTAIASVTRGPSGLIQLRRHAPFEAPHHSASQAAIVGGGARLAQPGAITRAHHGVLFLDEATEFSRTVLDALRQPLESGHIVLHRSAGSVTYPARFQLVLASNPCPCGMNTGSGRHCTCTVTARRQYMSRLSGPLLDRIDLQVRVERPRSAVLALGSSAENSAEVLTRVVTARAAQRERLAPWGVQTNSDMPMSLLNGPVRLGSATTRALDGSLDRASISLRGYVRVLRLAWTVADLRGSLLPTAEDIDAAMQLRQSAGDD